MPNREPIIKVKLSTKKDSSVKALANVTFITDQGEFTIYGYKVIQSFGNDPWLVSPEIQYKDKENNFKNFKIVRSSELFRMYLEEKIFAKYKELLENPST